PFKDRSEVSDVFEISPAVVTSSGDVKSLRLAAAQHGADALMVLSAGKDTDKYTNQWVWTYFAIIPAFFVPGSNTDVLFMTHAAMWDVRNGYLYLTADSESTHGQTRSAID